MTSDTKWIIGTLGTLILVSNMLLATFILSVDSGMAGARSGTWMPPSYDDGMTTYGSVSAGTLSVETPHGDRLTGQFSADQIGGVMFVTDERTKDSKSEEFDPRNTAVIGLAQRMLLELNGWPRERWPEGWTPE